jgi:ABC-2 type transport system ATP-binding protein
MREAHNLANGYAVEVQGITFGYTKTKIIDNLSIVIPTGTTFGMMGPNGAGKTTLIKLMIGLLKPDSGTIKVLCKNPSQELSYSIGYMPQLPSLYSELTVEQNIDFFANIYGLKDKKQRRSQVEKAIKLVDLYPRRREQISRLSGGMKQRVSLACSIVHNPPLLFLDEPTVGLDPMLRVAFWDYFNDLTSKGHTLVISSHTMDDAAHCDQLGLMREGKVIALDSPSELRKATGRKGATLEDAFLYFIRKEVMDNSH